MALFRRMPDSYMKEAYTHRGLYAYIVPVYLVVEEGVDYDAGAEMFMTERNGIPYRTIQVVCALWSVLTFWAPCLPPVHVTGEL